MPFFGAAQAAIRISSRAKCLLTNRAAWGSSSTRLTSPCRKPPRSASQIYRTVGAGVISAKVWVISPGPCAARGDHSYTDSGDYSLLHDLSGVAGQNNWRWCRKCQGLAFAGNQGSHCPAGGTHDLSASYDYLLLHDTPIIDAQSDWRWCSKCQGLAFAGNSAGVCPAGGEHLLTRSFNYYLINV